MVGNYKVITLCGSTKFKNVITPEIKAMFDDMHQRKIDISDEIYVINKTDI